MLCCGTANESNTGMGYRRVLRTPFGIIKTVDDYLISSVESRNRDMVTIQPVLTERHQLKIFFFKKKKIRYRETIVTRLVCRTIDNEYHLNINSKRSDLHLFIIAWSPSLDYGNYVIDYAFYTNSILKGLFARLSA